MKFSHIAVLAVVAPLASSFAPVVRQNAYRVNSLQKSKSPYDLDLTGITFPEPEPIKAAPVKNEPVKKAKKAPEPKPEPPKPAPKPEPKAQKAKTPPAPVPEPAKPASQAKKVTKAAPVVVPAKTDALTAKVQSLKAPPASKSVPTPPPPKPSAPASSDSSAVPLGVALGGVPLLLAPIIALGAGRDILAKTAARRAQIQEEIAAEKAAQAKKAAANAQADGSGVAKALVSVFVVPSRLKLGLDQVLTEVCFAR
jgi:hypothetical protein